MKRTAPIPKKDNLVSNLTSGEFRIEQFEDREHLVVPIVLMTEGVHSGSSGPLFYPAEELSTLAESWNGVPVPIFHPDNNGAPCSCNDPRVIERQNVGRLFNVRWENNKLKGEAWIDTEKAERVYPGIINSLKDPGTKMEVSTGLLSQHEIISGMWNNERYDAIVRNIRPDHLALLPGSRGACSWTDGCGVRNMETQDKYIQNLMGQRETHQKIYQFVDSMDNGNYVHFLEEVYGDYFIYRREAMNNNSAQRFTYFKVPYSVNEQDEISVDDQNISQVTKKVSYETISNNEDKEKEGMSKRVDNKEGQTDNQCPECKKVIDQLISNENTNWQEQDRTFLEEMDLQTLNKFLPKEKQVENKEEKVEETPKTAKEYIDNAPPEIKEVLNSAMAAHKAKKDGLIAKITGNARNKFTKEALEAKGVEELEMLAELATTVNYSGQGGNINNNEQEQKVEPLTIPVINYDNK